MKKRILLYDDVDTSPAGLAWRAAVFLYGGSFDVVVPCVSVNSVYRVLRERADDIEHMQVWGHGLPGKPLIALQPLDETRNEWIGARGASVWFRSCRVASTYAGQQFMNGLAQWGISPVAHLSKIGGTLLSQSYLVGIHDGARAWWPVDLLPNNSMPWAPRTVPVTRMTLPSWTFERGRGVP